MNCLHAAFGMQGWLYDRPDNQTPAETYRRLRRPEGGQSSSWERWLVIHTQGAFCFSGDSGTGKTCLALAVAAEMGAKLVDVEFQR